MKQMFLLLLVAVGLTYSATKCYDVVPYKNYIGVQEDGEAGITQTFVMTVDSLIKIDFWVGDKVDTSSAFHIVVRDSVSGAALARTVGSGVKPSQSWSWLPCPLYTTNGKKPKRGRTYKAIDPREGGAAIDGLTAGA